MKNFKAGNRINQGYYKSFDPTRIQRKWKLDDSKVINLLSKAAGVSMPTAYILIRSLEELEILQEVTGTARGRVYVFGKYLDLYRS